MNKVYRVVWNAATGTWAAVQETAKACKKSSRSATVGQATEGASTKVAGKLFALTMLGSAMLLSSQAFANTPPLTRTDADTPVATGDKCGYDAESASVICGDATTTLAKTYSGVSGDGSTHIHKTAKSVVLGIGAKSVEMDAAVGKDADLVAINAGHGESMVIIGANAQGSQQSSVAVGESAKALNGQTVAIGSNANAVGLADIMVGKGAGSGNTVTTAPDRNIGIGEGAVSNVIYANNVIGIGTGAASGSNLSNSIAIGVDANRDVSRTPTSKDIADAANLRAQGKDAEADKLLTTNVIWTTAVGERTIASGPGATAVGAGSRAFTTSSIAMGQGATAGAKAADGNVQSGDQANFVADYDADNAIALGTFSAAGRNAVAVGRQSRAVLSGTTAVGSNSKAVGLTSTAVGFNSIAASRNSVAMGWNSVAGVADSVDANGSTISGKTYAVAIGPAAKALETTSTALGNATLADKLNSVALGSASKTDADATKEDTATVGNLTYSGFAGDEGVAAGDQVSVGAKGEERQIKNVAPGQISNTSTDAINGSQLYATNDVLGNVADSVIDLIGGDAAYKPDSTGNKNGTIVAPNIANTGKDNINDAIIAARTEVEGAGLATVTSDEKDGKLTYTVNVAKAEAPTVERGKVTVKPEDQGKVMTAGDIAKAITDSEKTAAVVAATGSAITVQPGTEDPQTGVTTYTVDVKVDGTTITNENGVLKANFTDTNTITTVSSGSDNVTVTNVGTADAPNYQIKVDAVSAEQLEASKTRYYSVNDNGVQRANYNNDGATGINSLAAGTAASATESAATAVGNQATAAARNSVALGNQATANTAWSVAIGNKADATGSSAVAIGNGATTTVGDSVALGAGSKADANGRAVTEATVNRLTFDDFAGSVTHPGKVVSVGAKGEERQIKNVAAGQVTATSTDAINGSQLYATNDVLGNVAKTAAAVIGGDTTVDADGNITGGNIAGTSATNVSDAIIAARTEVKGTGPVTVTSKEDADKDGKLTYTVGVETVDLTNVAQGNEKAGSVVAPAEADAGKLVTATTVANAINNSGFTLASSNTVDNVTTPNSDEQLVNPGSTVTIDGGKNINVTQTGSTISVATKDEVEFTSVQFTENGPKITNNDGNINVGSSTGAPVKITNVAAGTAPTDAVNVSQLEDRVGGIENRVNNRIDDVADDANAGVSSAMAMAALPQAYIPGKSMLTGGIGSYNGEGAVAVGFSKLSDNGRWVMKMSGTADTEGNLGGAVGAGFHF